jgi:hypothetical protein
MREGGGGGTDRRVGKYGWWVGRWEGRRDGIWDG